jgi:predicted phosphate transport protein (TIGR00153 family)
MVRSIIPRDEVYFDSFEKICVLIVEAAEKLKTMLDGESPFEASARRIKIIENEADEQVHRAVEKLHKTFVTPLDRQDILKLTAGLDDIVDRTEAISARLDLYNPKRVMEEAKELTGVFVQAAKQVAEMVGLLRNLKKQSSRILEHALEINRLENEADQVHHKAIAKLFQEENDTKELIKWKDILDNMEMATDRCEDISDIVRGIVLENI